MSEILDVFPNDLPEIPFDRAKDFYIDLLPNSKPIYIHLIEWLK